MDSLYLAVHADLSEEDLDRLDESKVRAQRSGQRVTIEWGGRTWLVEPHGAGRNYGILLVNRELAVGVSRSRSRAVPSLYVKLDALALWSERGLDGCWRLVEGIARRVHHGAGKPRVIVSRVDVAADFQGIAFGRADRFDFVTRGAPDAGAFAKGTRQTGFSWGKGKVVTRVYDKAREITRSDKAWFWEIWKKNGADTSAGVWRVEAQFRRDALKEFRAEHLAVREVGADEETGETVSIDTLQGLRAALGALWRYAVGDPGERQTGWLSWRVPGNDKQRSRWKVRDEWERVRAVTWTGDQGSRLVRESKRTADADRMLAGVGGYARNYAAIRGVGSFWSAWHLIGRDLWARLQDRGEDWEADVRARAAMLAPENLDEEALAAFGFDPERREGVA